MSDGYDLIVIGAGPGGYALAERAARLGARTAIIEKDLWGGTCTHRGCIPTKTLLTCSKHYADLKKMKRLGIAVDRPRFDYAAMKRHQQQMVRIAAMGVEKSLLEAGVEMKAGVGRLLSSREVQWTDSDGINRTLQGDRIVIAWGAEPVLPSGIETSDRVLTSDGFLRLEVLPQEMIIVGGSVIGVEFATFLGELGVRVTLIECLEQILPYEDEDAAALVKQEMVRLGVAVHNRAELKTIRRTADAVEAIVMLQGREAQMTADAAVICIGRKPLLDQEQLDRFGIQYDRRGIIVDARQMTNIPNLYAIGDVTGGAMLAHRAIQQGRALADALFGNGSIIYSDSAVPSVVYSHPQIAHVGLTEKETQRRGLSVEMMRSDYAGNLIARSGLMGQGFVKLLFNEGTLIGATVVGEGASELIAPLGLAVANHLGKKELNRWIIPHPTLSEVLIRN